jgi:hypothetical protein
VIRSGRSLRRSGSPSSAGRRGAVLRRPFVLNAGLVELAGLNIAAAAGPAGLPNT